MTLIEYVAVSKTFEKPALKSVDFQIEENTITAIIGPSGAGKTTLLRLLIGFYQPTKGSIKVSDKVTFGFGTQDDAFYDELTCKENLEYFAALYKVPESEVSQRITEVLSLVGLQGTEDVQANKMSGGMRRRLDLAIAIFHKPSVLILDEPVAGLDPRLRRQIWKLVEKIRDSGITIIVASHMLVDVEHICDKLIFLYDGSVIEKGSPLELKEKHSRNEEIRIELLDLDYDSFYKELTRKGLVVEYAWIDEHVFVIYVSDAEHALPLIFETARALNKKLLETTVAKPTLSEVFEVMVENLSKGDSHE